MVMDVVDRRTQLIVGESRLWAGIHFRSDIDTGLALGRAIANLVIERAKKDGLQ